ncbi:MAG: AraC family transcriptional regulator, partial [Pseudomonadales bacterium]|nr:AraC family transcriptional regulator [Pseudomonadales bacterium]
KYLKTRFNLLQVSAFVEGDEAVIQVESTLQLEPTVERFLLQSVFTSFGVMAQNLMGAIPDQVRTLCTYSQAEDPRLDSLFNGRRPVFEQPVNQIRLPKQVLALPLTMSDPVSRQLMEAQCRKELAAIDKNVPLLIKVKQLMGAESGRFPKLEDIASQCCMSERTFKRRLAELGTSYQVLLDSERERKAVEYLRHTRKTVDEIALLLGYNDPSNFSRAFKRWTGSTPAQFRHQH